MPIFQEVDNLEWNNGQRELPFCGVVTEEEILLMLTLPELVVLSPLIQIFFFNLGILQYSLSCFVSYAGEYFSTTVERRFNEPLFNELPTSV